MTHPVKAIPDGYYTVTPYLFIKNASEAIDFYKKAFGAIELFRFAEPDGKVHHAEIKIGNSIMMLAEESREMNALSPQSYGGSAVNIHLYVEDVDSTFNQAISSGAQAVRPVQDQFYGDRLGMLVDPFGHRWSIATHKEDVSPEEIHKRCEAAAKEKTCC